MSLSHFSAADVAAAACCRPPGRSDHEGKKFQVTAGASGKAAAEQENRRQRMAVTGGLHAEGALSRYGEWKKAEKRAKQLEKDQQRAQAEQDAKFRAGMMLKMRKSKAQKNILAFKDLKSGMKCDAKDRYGTWYEASVIAENKKSVKMHFEGREGRYDEWIDRDSANLAMLGSHRGPAEWGLITPANQDKVLWQCILRDDADVLKRLLSEFTVDINLPNKGGQTPLSLAIERGKPAVTALLHSFTGSDSQAMEVRTTANAHRRAKEARWGRSGDTDPRRSENCELQLAAGAGNAEEVKRLLAAGLEVDALSQAHHYFGAPIHFAARGASAITVPHIGTRPAAPGRPSTVKHREVIDVLLAAGGDVDVVDERGHTALMRAASYGDPQVVAQLLAAGANPNLTDHTGWTPMRHATMVGNHDACAVLQDVGSVDAVEESKGASKAANVKRLLRAGAAAGVASMWNNNIDGLKQKSEVDRWRDAKHQMELAMKNKQLAKGTRIAVHPWGEGSYIAKKRGCCGCACPFGRNRHWIDVGAQLGAEDGVIKSGHHVVIKTPIGFGRCKGPRGIVRLKSLVKKRGSWRCEQGVVEERGSRWKDAEAQMERLRKDKACAIGTQVFVEEHGQGSYVSFKKRPIISNKHKIDFGGDVGILSVKLKSEGCCFTSIKEWTMIKKWGVGIVCEKIEEEAPKDKKDKGKGKGKDKKKDKKKGNK